MPPHCSLTRLRSQVRSGEVKMLSIKYSDYNLITLKGFGITFLWIFYDKHVYFFDNECSDSSERQ